MKINHLFCKIKKDEKEKKSSLSKSALLSSIIAMGFSERELFTKTLQSERELSLTKESLSI